MKLEGIEAVEAEMAKRALAEVVGHYVLGAGHGLFNLAARTVALDGGLKSALSGALGTHFPPLSERSKTGRQQIPARQRRSRPSRVPHPYQRSESLLTPSSP